MLPIKAYFVEAYYKCMVDSGFTPHVVVDATIDYIEVPKEYVFDGQIILNLSPEAIRDLVFHPAYLSFRTQFSGVTHSVYLPIIAVLSIFAKENSEDYIFEMSLEDNNHALMQPMPKTHFENDDGKENKRGNKKGSLHLKLIKDEE